MNESTTYQTYLMHGTGTGTVTYSKLLDIKEFPDLGGTPEAVEVTTLSDSMRRYVPGIQDTEALEFLANYVLADYQTCKALENKQEKYAVWFDDGTANAPTGELGKWEFTGALSVYVTGGGVNDPREMQITITPSTVITFNAD